MIILDACRYDMFCEIVATTDKSSVSWELHLRMGFEDAGVPRLDVAYVSGNPCIASVPNPHGWLAKAKYCSGYSSHSGRQPDGVSMGKQRSCPD